MTHNEPKASPTSIVGWFESVNTAICTVWVLQFDVTTWQLPFSYLKTIEQCDVLSKVIENDEKRIFTYRCSVLPFFSIVKCVKNRKKKKEPIQNWSQERANYHFRIVTLPTVKFIRCKRVFLRNSKINILTHRLLCSHKPTDLLIFLFIQSTLYYFIRTIRK